MDKQGNIRSLPPGEEAKLGKIVLSGETVQEIAGLSNKARKVFYKTVRAGYSEDFAIACALSIDGVFVGGGLRGDDENRETRRGHAAGKNPRVAKGGTNWRVKHWKWGITHPRNTDAGREARA